MRQRCSTERAPQRPRMGKRARLPKAGPDDSRIPSRSRGNRAMLMDRRHRSGVLNVTVPPDGQAEQLRGPIERQRLELGRRR